MKKRPAMKKMTRIVSLLLIAVFVMSCLPVTAAAAPSQDQPVARMWIFAYTKNVLDIGHGFLYFENLTDETITVGAYQLKPHGAVSVGTFGLTRDDGNGIYYNMEAYCINHYNQSGSVAYSMELTAGQLQTVNGVINSNNKWNLIKDCCWFATTVWNSVASSKITKTTLPSLLKSYIKKKSGYVSNFKMYSPQGNEVYKHVNSSTIKPVSGGSLKGGL